MGVNAFAAKLEEIRGTTGDRVRLDDVADIVAALVDSAAQQAAVPQSVSHEIRELLDYITNAKEEIGAIRPADMGQRAIPKAQSELDAVVAATEKAAGTIMDAADQLMELSSEVEGPVADKLMELSTTIFEASTFQDITGQRINKVVGTLRHLEERLLALATAIGDEDVEPEEHEVHWTNEGLLENDREILEGPQLEGSGNSQDDIDALLASFD